jgi:hypothetical protein
MGQESLTRFDQPKKKTTTKTEISTDLKPTGSKTIDEETNPNQIKANPNHSKQNKSEPE